MRTHLETAVHPAPDTAAPGAPPSRDQATASALRRILSGWDSQTVGELTRAEITELYLFDSLLRATAGQAGALAQLFHRPDIILDVRDKIADIEHRRSAFERQQAVFEATCRLWRQSQAPSDMSQALQDLSLPDIDLWHRIVLEHDPTDPGSRDAALWCVSHPTCDQATVASYLLRIVTEGHLRDATMAGDKAFTDAILAVIEAWNDKTYQTAQLGLAPPESVAVQAPVYHQAIDALAVQTGEPHLPEPKGLFRAYYGRSPQPRHHWCLTTGQLIARPQRADYVDAGGLVAA